MMMQDEDNKTTDKIITQYKCDKCEHIDQYLTDAINHLLFTHEYGTARKCACGVTAKSFRGLKQHIRKRHEEDYKPPKSMRNNNQIVQCLLYDCGVEMYNRNMLAQHYKRVHQFPPDECIALIDDGHQHHIIPRQCVYCNQTEGFITTIDYWRHVVNEHPARHRVAIIPASITVDRLTMVIILINCNIDDIL
jgi:hypothetical protein